MIRFHPSTILTTRWIGVDLNTTGHVAVVADPESGKVLKLGKNIHHLHAHSIKNCTKLFKEGKLWKLKKTKTREQKEFRSALHAICRQIVSFAEHMGTGIKFERLFSTRYSRPKNASDPFTFSFGNGSFFSLQRLVEKKAHDRGIDVIYVNPAYTSKRCSRCGHFGRRSQKHFECPHCGYVAHADVNAAFNIAATPLYYSVPDSMTELTAEEMRFTKKQLRRMNRAMKTRTPTPAPAITSGMMNENMLAVLL
ncbi:RNA-guided endonuclease TnpB family protein [Methanoregula sp.]|uniref:RNA-guided endonuclease TnpB family protein n=1 Tax=Methanoregula sp. TaxID=2052170 RepID=UPI0023762D93|nr:RNA-guided endonuclease TnpB family protein [Methanoregula sp.]MDD1685691.1 RNA-guided endonuclease TnpB family protein [Methanoregula sp.]